MANDPRKDFDVAHATEETDVLDFKSGFDPRQPGEWCELIKDIVAMANSGGGSIVIGANDDGTPSGYDVAILRAIDPADVANKIHKYTEQHFTDFHLQDAGIAGAPVAELSVGGVRYPIVFSAPGEYEHPPGKVKSAFRKGTVYFRHGAKSEPGTTDDLRNALERELERVRSFWLEGITKVVEAPAGSEVQVVQSAITLRDARSDAAQPIRLTATGEGPEFRVVDNDQVYPHRAKEVLQKLSELLGHKVATSYDLQIVRKQFDIDTNPNFSHKGRFGTRQYSDAFIEWIVGQHGQDSQFFQKAREAVRTAHGTLA